LCPAGYTQSGLNFGEEGEENMKVCSTCNKEVTDDYVDFKCPKCGSERIVRCLHCRTTSKPYTCKECGFIGP